MPRNLTRKILEAHLVEGELVPGREIGVKIDHALLQDATGTVAMLEFEALNMERVKIGLAVQYVDHNILQTDSNNADDHRYLQTASARYGLHFSPPGNGVSHQAHMERFGEPGKIVLGSDSHTPGAAGVSMLGIGAGGLDVALAMAGMPYHLPCPKVLGVRLTGELPEWVSGKDVILEMLRRHGVKGCVGKVVEYYGPGVATLSATDRETIGNMGTELGATTSIFPSDERTKAYLQSQGRGRKWKPLAADEGAEYDEHDEIDLSAVEPLIALPSSPGNVVPVREVAGLPVDQAIVGSSVNSSFRDLMVAAKIVEGRHAHPRVSFHINPGSRQVMENVAKAGGVLLLLRAGARIHESGCLGCIGMGQAPGTGQVSLRTFPRNFPGRSGTKDDKVYLCSPETAAAAALKGVITDPRDLGKEMAYPKIEDPKRYLVDSSSIIAPSEELCPDGGGAGPQHPAIASDGPLGGDAQGGGDDQGGGQHLHGYDHAGREQGAPVALQHRGDQQVRLLPDRPRLPQTLPGEGFRGRGGRRELRSGIEQGACGPRPALSGGTGEDREELRQDPQGQSHQLWNPPSHLPRSGGLRCVAKGVAAGPAGDPGAGRAR